VTEPTATATSPSGSRPEEVSGTLGRIALGLSGGGYRAAAFHLGALAVLDHLGLAGDVTALSTVSGGTLTGARWAWGLARHERFETSFRALYGFLRDTDCVQEAIDTIGSRRATPSQRISLITAAAQLYASKLTPDATFAALLDSDAHLEEVSFNTTEFQSGLNFRFLKSASTRAPIGNGKYWLEPAAARQLRLGDILAASSCFPGGFEPMAFPDDFVWPGGVPPAGPSLTPNALGRIPRGLALMDGGIHDNQGVEALIQAEERAARKGASFGLALVSDADQDPTLFAVPAGTSPEEAEADAAHFRFGPQERGWLTFPLLRGAFWATVALALAVALGLVWALANDPRPAGLAWLPTLVLLALVLMVAGGAPLVAWWLRGAIRGPLRVKVSRLWAFLREQRLSVLRDLVVLRGRSLHALTSRVFMKRIRALGLARLFTAFGGRALANQVSDLLAAEEVWDRNERYQGLARPSPALLACARTAHELETTLWFEDEAQLRAVVAAGCGTLCFNLLVHVRGRLEGAADDPRLQHLELQLLSLWEALNRDPALLVYGAEPQKA
jgi:predicted acylesterase/phospholipase RssA